MMLNLYFFLLLTFTACSSDANKGFGSIEEIKKDFITTILTESSLDEGPFQMNYHLRAILFSDNVVSLMGDVFVFAHLPHGWMRYEGKTYVKTNGSFKEISLDDLFPHFYALGGKRLALFCASEHNRPLDKLLFFKKCKEKYECIESLLFCSSFS